MLFKNVFIESLYQLKLYQLQSILTLLGIVIGVGSIIGIVSMGTGLRHLLSEEIQKVGGGNLISVTPREFVMEDGQFIRATQYDALTEQDIPIIEQVSTQIEMVVPVASLQAEVRYKNKSFFAQIEGTTAAYAEAYQWPVYSGRFLSRYDISQWRSVCVLGSSIAQELFGNKSPLGQEIKIDEKRYTIIGVMSERKIFGVNWGFQVMIPITSAQKRLTNDNTFSMILIALDDLSYVHDIESVVQQRLKMHHGSDSSYNVQSNQTVLESLSQIVLVIQIVVGCIASISLLVGGIGIMNLMLVSVTERTREIAIRKTVGARRLDILWQFTIEAVVISFLGGVVGVLCGFGFGESISILVFYIVNIEFPSVVSLTSVIIALLVSFGVGLFFGIYPAAKASQLNPISGLQHE